MKFVSWNVNGLRACAGKGFADIFVELDADFFCLQETKMQPGQLDLEFPDYTSYWNAAEKKGYSGTAIYTRREPLAVTYGTWKWKTSSWSASMCRIRRTASAGWTTGCGGRTTSAPT